MAFSTLRHACMSTLPADSICVYCIMASACTIVSAPPASKASLNASAMFVASRKLWVNGASCCTMPATAFVLEGRPSNDLPICLMLAAASLLE